MLKHAYTLGYNAAVKQAGATHALVGGVLGAGLGLGAATMLDLDDPAQLAAMGGLGALGGAGAGLYANYRGMTAPAIREALGNKVDDAQDAFEKMLHELA